MTKKVLLFAIVILSISSYAQKAQRIGYIDMEYILENIPEYIEAQSQINTKANSWQQNIVKSQLEIESLKSDLAIEKALLTKDLIAEREEDIQIRILELKKLEDSYFGTDGDLFFLRQQLVQPIQDMVYNAIQDIAVKRKYDFILDKSSDLIMLYSNDQFDLSELILDTISKTKKVSSARSGSNNSEEATSSLTSDENSTNTDVKISDRALKKAELQKKIEEKKAAQLKKREELKKAIEAKKQQRIKEIEAAKKAKEQIKQE
jgi:Skp family chaperone for outer membrane proteins